MAEILSSSIICFFRDCLSISVLPYVDFKLKNYLLPLKTFLQLLFASNEKSIFCKNILKT
jgi:hypothetical protein